LIEHPVGSSRHRFPGDPGRCEYVDHQAEVKGKRVDAIDMQTFSESDPNSTNAEACRSSCDKLEDCNAFEFLPMIDNEREKSCTHYKKEEFKGDGTADYECMVKTKTTETLKEHLNTEERNKKNKKYGV